jgi:type VII secretion protein EccB
MPMQSRTDQVHSYQFFLQRVVSGLVARESDPAELPFRRLGWSAFGSFMVAVLVAAGFGVYGILVGGGATSWRDGGSVIVEKGSEAPYIYRDERLYPMLNVVSAQLALGGDAGVTRVSARSLEGVPRGPTLGIPGAPQGLPDGQQLLTGGWTLCSQEHPDGQGGRETFSVLGVGRPPEGGQPAGERAILVRDAGVGDSDPVLVWHGHRFGLADPAPALLALGASRESALPVASGWLDALPVGDRLAPPEVADRGAPSSAFGELRDLVLRSGQVIEVAGRHYLVRAEDLLGITPLQADLVVADPATDDAYPDQEPQVLTNLPPGVMANARIDDPHEPSLTSPPQTRPELVSQAPQDVQDAVVCAAFSPGEFVPEVVAGGRLPVGDAIGTPQRTAEGRLLTDYVLVEGGSAALVQTVASPDATGGSWHIVTDQGVRYALPAPEVAAVFGYQLDRRVRVPAGLLALLPAGPVLDPATAALPADLPAAGEAPTR